MKQHVTNKIKMNALYSSLLVMGVLTQYSDGALTITVSGEPTSTTARITFSGDLELTTFFPNFPPSSDDEVRVPEAEGFGINDSTRLISSLDGNPFVKTEFLSPTVGAANDAVLSYVDTSAGGVVLGTINNFESLIVFGSSNSLAFRLASEFEYGFNILDGDVLLASGSYEVNLADGDLFEDQFNYGVYSQDYNGQNISFIITQPIPEPASISFLFLGLIGILSRRSR